MRQLNSGIYTHAQVAARLTDPGASIGCRFELLAPDLSTISLLPTDSFGGGIDAAAVEMNVDRTVKGAMTLTMLPETTLIKRLFQRRIRAWWRIQMPDTGIAEFPMGVFVWNTPDRDLQLLNDERWTLTLGDQGHILDAGGPGTVGFTAVAGERISTAIERAVRTAGFQNTTGIAASNKLVTADTTWGLTDENNQPMTWTRVLTDLHVSAGFYSPWFDGYGIYRASVQPDLVTKVPDWNYEPGQASILQNAQQSNSLDGIANRVFIRSSSQGGAFGTAVADLDTVIPGHPLSRSVIGFYIDVVLDDAVAATLVDLQLRANNELLQRCSLYEKLTVATLANPAHEAFDVLRFAWTGDSEFATGARWHERNWKMDLFTGEMSHELSRLVDVT